MPVHCPNGAQADAGADTNRLLATTNPIASDTADFVMALDKEILSSTIGLPGGSPHREAATAPLNPPGTTPPSMATALTTDTAGRQVGPLRTYSPFGEALTSDGAIEPDAVPNNQPGHMDYGWLGQHQRPYEHAGALALVQMGARPTVRST